MSDPSQSQHRASDVERGSHDSQLCGNLKAILAKLLPFFDIETTWGCRLYIAAYLIALIAHPDHYYDYVIKAEQNCLEKVVYDTYFTIATVLIFNIYVQLTFIIKLRKTGREAMKYVFTQIPAWFMTLMLIPHFTSGNEDRILSITANVFLYVYILLLFILQRIITKAIENSSAGNFAKVWGKASLNFYLYLFGGQVFGALWYFFAIGRVVACWREDYFSRNHFDPHSFFCRYKHKNIGELNCPQLKKVGTEINEFGIFNLALQSRIAYLRRDFGKRLLYGFRWGLQALSCFGQNLLPSTFVLENIFVISIIIYSTVLFALFIGNVETYLQSNGEEPKYIINRLRMEDCLQRLKDVQELNDCEDSQLNELYRRIKPVSYGKGTLIVREGEPISEVLFVLKGNLWTCTSTATDHGNGGNVKTFGKELVRWIQDHPQSFSLPISSSTIKAVENVEAFALTADDLKAVLVNITFRMTTRSILRRCFQF